MSNPSIIHLSLSYNSYYIARLVCWPVKSPRVSVWASWKPQPQAEQAASSLRLSTLFRNV